MLCTSLTQMKIQQRYRMSYTPRYSHNDITPGNILIRHDNVGKECPSSPGVDHNDNVPRNPLVRHDSVGIECPSHLA